MASISEFLPQLRFEITEAARILRISRAMLYQRIRVGSIAVPKDGRRTFITTIEIHRYVTPAQYKPLLSTTMTTESHFNPTDTSLARRSTPGRHVSTT